MNGKELSSDRVLKIISWNYREDKATIEWIDDDTVIINGHELDVPAKSIKVS